MTNTQKVFFETKYGLVQLDLPDEKTQVMPNVPWGNVAGFPTVAFWLYKVLESRINGDLIRYKLGNSLLEEVGACLLGGHGIPAANGLAAFTHLRDKGIFTGSRFSQSEIFHFLSEPIKLNEKSFRYRFAKQKSNYIYAAIEKINREIAPTDSGKSLREWLLGIKGIGPKTASWIARNWLDADDVAILDIHIYRAGLLGGFFDEKLSVEKNYLDLEERFLDLASSMNVRASELDAVIWYEMQKSNSVLELLSSRKHKDKLESNNLSNYCGSDPQQVALI